MSTERNPRRDVLALVKPGADTVSRIRMFCTEMRLIARPICEIITAFNFLIAADSNRTENYR